MNHEAIDSEAQKLHREIWKAYKAVVKVPAVDPCCRRPKIDPLIEVMPIQN